MDCAACGGACPDGMRFCGHCGRPLETSAQEQRVITALFADISGFTSLADRLEAERLAGIIGPVIEVLATTAERYGGTLAKYAGDAVLVFFGAPVAQEDHAQRALRCAADMHADLQAALPSLAPEAAALELHIGVNSGRVVTGMFGGDLGSDYSILGDAVNVAQRLESVAPPGETYVGETTQQLAATEFVLEPLGELTLKGKAAPVAAWRLAGLATPEQRPARRAAALVGRDAELARADALLDRLPTCGGVLAVTADPGAGKSRLAEEVRTRAGRADLGWLEARSLSYGASLPYWPFVDLLRRTLGVHIDQDPVEAGRQVATAPSLAGIPAGAAFVCRLLGLPSADREIAQLSPEAFQRGLADVVEAWLARLAQDRPLVLLLEDLHWLDSASLDLVQRVLRLTLRAPVLLFLTGRPESVETVEVLREAMPADHVVHVHLGPLDRAAAHALVAAALGGEAATTLAAEIHARASGNPFFVEELARSLHDSGALVRGPAGWALRPDHDVASTPATVEAVLAARMDLLPAPAAQLLQAAAVIGRQVDRHLLNEVSDVGARTDVLLEQLVDAGFLDRFAGDRLRFHHALMVDVAYGRLVRRQRVDLHRRVAEAAEVLYGTADDVVDLLARHLYLAEAGVKAVDHLQRAADRARSLYANDQAALHLSRAVELARRTPRVTSRLPVLLLALADVQDLSGDYAAARAHYEEVRGLTGDVAAWRGLAAVLRRQGEVAASLAVVEEGLAALADAEDVAPLWLERTATLAFEGRPADAVLSALAGLAVAPPDSPVAAELLVRLARAEETTSDFDAALSHAREAERIFTATADPRGLALTYRVLGGLLGQAGQGEEAVAVLQRGLAYAERTGSSEELAGCLLNLGYAEMTCGRVAEGAAYDERAVALFAQAGNLNGQATAHANLAEKLVLLGRLDEGVEHVDRALVLTEHTGAQITAADALRTLALARLQQGRVAEARQVATDSARRFTACGDAASGDELLRRVAAADEGEGLLQPIAIG